MRVMVLTDRKRIVITEAEEKTITKALERPAPFMTVKGIPYKKTLFGYFDDPTHEELMGIQAVMDVFPGAKQMTEGLKLKCRGQYSINAEIIQVAKRVGMPKGKGLKVEASPENPNGYFWPKLLRDSEWRAMIRDMLWEQSDQWCDYRKDICKCEDSYQPSPFKPGRIFA